MRRKRDVLYISCKREIPLENIKRDIFVSENKSRMEIEEQSEKRSIFTLKIIQ